MKIVHVSDVHVRNLRYHDEYRRVFDDLYSHLDRIRPDVVINTGDTAHTKVQISPEFVEMVSDHIRQVAARAPYHMILGNHDFNLMNPDRQDAISPIVDGLRAGGSTNRAYVHKRSGLVELDQANLWVFSMADRENQPTRSDWDAHPERVNIGLFHGSVANCVTDSNWRMTQTEREIETFDGLDFVLMGDIHKQQFFRDRRIAYAGSLIQQNFGEELVKGFLLWDIRGKDDFEVSPVELRGSRKFYTVRLADDLSLPDDVPVEPGSRVRLSPPREMTLSEQKLAERQARSRYGTADVITLSVSSVSSQRVSVDRSRVVMENLRQVAVQERLISAFLQSRDVSPGVMEQILDLNRRFQMHLDKEGEPTRDVRWSLEKIFWSNLFNFGENNFIDFSKLGGLTGIFAANASGKSNIIDVITETLFDGTTRGVSKNIFLINDNRQGASSIAEVSSEGSEYVIERTIERVKYGKRKFAEAREWGKTAVDFYSVDRDGARTNLNGTLRPETERSIRQRLGTFEDLMLTSLFAQWSPMDIISCKETDRKKILYRFLDLDTFEEKHRMAREEGKQFRKRLLEMEGSGLEEEESSLLSRISETRDRILESERILSEMGGRHAELTEEIISLGEQKTRVPARAAGAAHDIPSLESARDAMRGRLRTLQERLDQTTTDGKSVVSEMALLDQDALRRAQERLVLVRKEIEDRSGRAARAASDASAHRRRSELLTQVPCGDMFPRCRFLVDAFASQARVPESETLVAALEGELSDLRSEEASLQPARRSLEELERLESRRRSLVATVKDLRLHVENARLKLSETEAALSRALEERERAMSLAEDERRNSEVDRKISDVRKTRADLDERIKAARDSLGALSRQLGADEGALARVSSQLQELSGLRSTCDAYELYCEAMGKDGIAYHIMAQKLPLINEEINKILGSSSEFGVMIEHDNEEQSIRIYIQYGDYKMRLLELGSGAEKMLASIAIRAALLSISSLPRSNLFIIDEGFGKLDARSLESVQKMFDYLRTVFEHVLVISHVDGLKDMVDNIIEISTDEFGYAHVEAGG